LIVCLKKEYQRIGQTEKMICLHWKMILLDPEVQSVIKWIVIFDFTGVE